MTYLQFLLLFLVPPIVFLLAAVRLAGPPMAGRLGAGAGARSAWGAVALIVVLALVYSTPWDNFLVARGVWTYPPGRVLFTIGYVPFEEYLFFVLQPILSSLTLFLLARRLGPAADVTPRSRTLGRLVGTASFIVLTVIGAALLRVPSGFYLGLILVWASPVAALQWGVGGGNLIAYRRLVLAAIAIPTLYLWIADRVALGLGIWSISKEATTGIALFGLPFEEALFFLVTNVMVVQGVTLFLTIKWRHGPT